MNPWVSICGEHVYAGGKDAAAYRLRCAVFTVVVLGAMAMTGNSFAQSQIPRPASAAEIAAVEKNVVVSDVTKPSQSPAKQKKDDPTKPKKQKRGSFIIAPIPISSPAFGSGLLLITSYVFKFDEQDKTSPPSWIGMAGAFTNNGTRGLVLGGRLYLKENKYQTTFAVAKGRANLDFFGVGRIPGRLPVSVPLRMAGTIFFGEAMRNVWRNIFVGPRYQYRRLSANIDGPPRPGGFEVPALDIKSTSAAMGVHVQRDLRDSTFYPTKGSLFDFTGDFFAPAFGSRRTYQTYKIAYNGFREMAARQVLAYRVMACSANGSVPFYDLCLYGFSSDLRGYTTGQFQDRRMFATQAEYRIELRKRLGVVAFGGVGGTARRWGTFRSDQLLPAIGAGLRFNLDKKNHINYRVDFAIGREGHTISIGVGEAF
jgi:hypothetical protein